MPDLSSAVDTALDRSVLGGFSAVGYAVRRRLPGWPADPAPGALTGQVALVTGASSGLGIDTAEGLGRLGAQVHLLVRDLAKGRSVAADLRRRVGPQAGFRVWRADLSDLTSVAAVADELLAELGRLDVLVHNAGVMPASRTESAQGHELSMAVHVLGPALLTERLLPLLRAPVEPARIVLVTSGGMYAQVLRADDPDFHDGTYSPTTAYARSKRAQVELLAPMARHWSPAQVFATHPGWAATPGVSESLPTFGRLTKPILRSSEVGADTTVWLAATAPRGQNATLWHDRRARPTSCARKTETDDTQRNLLWQWVIDSIGVPDAH